MSPTIRHGSLARDGFVANAVNPALQKMEPSIMVCMSFALRRFAAPALCAGLVLSIASTAGFADERCGQLVALNKQYAGVKLTSEQKQIKVQLVAWYNENCGRVAGAGRRALLGASGNREAQN